MPLYSLVPSFRPLLAPVPRLKLRTDTHIHTHTDRQTHTQDNYRNPPAHARRGLIRKLRANARTRTVPVEGAIAAFHSEVKLGPCTSVLRIVLHNIIINSVYIASLHTIFRIAHQGTFILHVFLILIDVLLHAQQ